MVENNSPKEKIETQQKQTDRIINSTAAKIILPIINSFPAVQPALKPSGSFSGYIIGVRTAPMYI